jgi:methyl-accepting chemotaxis protein
MKNTIGTKIYAGYFLAIVILAIIGISTYRNTRELLEDSKSVTYHNEVKTKINAVLSTIKDAEIGHRGYIITGDDSYLTLYYQGRDSVYSRLIKLQTMITDNEMSTEQAYKLKPLVDKIIVQMEEINQLRKNKEIGAFRNSDILGEGKEIMSEIRAILRAMTLEETRLLGVQNVKMVEATDKTFKTIIWGIPIAIILLALVGFFLTQNISRPLKQVTQLAESISNRDLSMNIKTIERSDEIGVMMLSFNKMIKMLREQNQEILEGVNVIASTSAQILTSTAQISIGSAETASSISETSTTVEEIRQAAQLSSQKAKYLSDNANRISQISQSGQIAVNENVDEIKNINKQMDEIAQTVILLSEQNQSIGSIIASVTNLADQSNLLAVNAAIESAKAGEQGKGFSVVAQEIRNLAEQSKQATLQIRDILNNVQKATTAAVLATEKGNRAVEKGVKKSIQAGETIRVLMESSEEAVQISIQIVASSQQQLLGMDQIGYAMQNINQAGLETGISMTQTEQALSNLHTLGQKLKELVEQFKM